MELTDYQDLWTDVERYRLVIFEDQTSLDAAVVFDAVSGAPLIVDADPGLYRQILEKMLAAGVQFISADDAKRLESGRA